MNDTIYRGMRNLVYVALGKTAYSNSSEYLELKKAFQISWRGTGAYGTIRIFLQ